MKRYKESSLNFDYAPRFDINSVDTVEAIRVSRVVDDLNKVVEVSEDEVIDIFETLKSTPSDIIEEEFLKEENSSPYHKVEGVDKAYRKIYVRREVKEYRYDLCVIRSRYVGLWLSKAVRLLLERRAPDIFKNKAFYRKKRVDITGMSVKEFLTEAGLTITSDITDIYRVVEANENGLGVYSTESKFKIYEPRDKMEIYLETGSDGPNGGRASLYIPIEAIRENDFSIIEKRMESYFKDYYRGRENYFDMAMSALDSSEAKELKRILDERKSSGKVLV